ncbi:MAG: hypothetical protein QG597_4420 [Actinomycetota bacterium]|nr:hypothetical protein [Actinomycetota bacterium]
MTAESTTTVTMVTVVEVIGLIAFAVSGVMAAARAGMDWLAAIVLAVVVAVGGGTTRDILIGHVPVDWMEDPWQVFLAIGVAAVVLLVARIQPNTNFADWTPSLIADAAGLSAFVIVGTQDALSAGLSGFLAVILGTITGVGGGVLRDVLTGNRPIVLSGEVYALAGIAGSTVYLLLVGVDVRGDVAVWLSMGTVFGIRVLAIRHGWRVPQAGATT